MNSSAGSEDNRQKDHVSSFLSTVFTNHPIPHTMSHTTAEVLFERVYDILTAGNITYANSILHDILIQTCHAGTKETEQSFGNIFSQVDYLCKRCRISAADKHAIQRMRRHSNHDTPLSREEFLYDVRALCLFISAVFNTAVPSHIVPLIPTENRPAEHRREINARYIRCIVKEWDGGMITAETEQDTAGGSIIIDCNSDDFMYITDIIRPGTQLNLLDCNIESGTVTPAVIVFEPDFLIDISSIANCFKDHGHHPMSYTVNRMQPRANTYATLLGNFAGSALDDIVSRRKDYAIAGTLRNNFKEKATEYCSCLEFNGNKFKKDAAVQVNNIMQTANVLAHDYDLGQVTVEPSFVCEQLGVQGRIDLMTTDMRLLVEQKSGRNMNIEQKRANAFGSMQTESHYVQLLLYYGVLKYNFKLGRDSTDIRLLYSKYPPADGLLVVAYYRRLFLEAIKTRNLIVAGELKIASDGFESVIDDITPETLNTAHDTSPFYHRYIYPQTEAVTKPLHGMTPLEREYFCRMMTSVYREQRVCKLGAQEGVTGCAADLWNMTTEKKKDNGSIYTGLTLTGKEKSDANGGYDMITLGVPQDDDDFMPNFRTGDIVLLYSYAKGKTPDVRENILYKGNIAEIRSEEIVIALADGQRNNNFLGDVQRTGATGGTRLVAVEHAVSDASTNASIRGLHEFITSSKSRKELLLAQRAPVCDTAKQLSCHYNPAYDDILLRAKRARDYFILIGPPGTGKTSMALRYIVEEELADGDIQPSILLMAYTNRAVDEICDMLEDAGLEYLRLGGTYSCDKRFRQRLIRHTAENNPYLVGIRAKIAETRIITCTTSALMSRPYFFRIKHFSLAVIDEASQILEPNIIGLLSAHLPDKNGGTRCCIDRFIMIGDHKQLPAVVQQSEKDTVVDSAALNGIGLYNCRNSLFERLINIERKNNRTEFIGVLNRHGRMHPDIAGFPCSMFYTSEQLKPVPLPHQREKQLGYEGDAIDDTDRLLRQHRMVFIPSPDCRNPNISDNVNTAEAAIVAQTLYRIYRYYGNRFEPSKTVGIIVPYRNQIATIRREIEKLGIPELEKVSTDTVERYQGSQREVIIYSFTIQNRYQLDFLTNNSFCENGHTIDRKLNVAITRARRQMIMTGNVRTLTADPVFHRLMEYIKEKGGMADCPLETAPA